MVEFTFGSPLIAFIGWLALSLFGFGLGMIAIWVNILKAREISQKNIRKRKMVLAWILGISMTIVASFYLYNSFLNNFFVVAQRGNILKLEYRFPVRSVILPCSDIRIIKKERVGGRTTDRVLVILTTSGKRYKSASISLMEMNNQFEHFRNSLCP